MEGASLDHLVSPRDKRLRKCKPYGGRRFEVHRQCKLGRFLNRQIGWSSTTQDAIDIRSGASIEIGVVDRIGHHSAALHENFVAINRRQPMLCRKLNDKIAVLGQKRVDNADDSAAVRTGQYIECAFDVFDTATRTRDRFGAKCSTGFLR